MKTAGQTYSSVLVRSLITHHQHNRTPEDDRRGVKRRIRHHQERHNGQRSGLYLKVLLRSMSKSRRLQGERRKA